MLGAFGSSAKIGDAAAPATIAVLILILVWEQILAVLGVAGIAFAALLFHVLRSGEFETVPAKRTANTDDADETAENIWNADRRTYMYPLLVIYVFFISKKFAAEGIKTFLPAFLVGVYAYSFEVLGVALEPESVANFYFSGVLLFATAVQLYVGGLTDRFDPRVVLIGDVGLATFGLLGLAVLDLAPIPLMLVLLLLGGGIWGLAPARDALISDISPAGREGRTFGYIWTTISLSSVAMPVFIGYIIEAVGLRTGFLMLTAGTAVAAVSISFLFLDRVYLSDEDLAVRPNKAD